MTPHAIDNAVLSALEEGPKHGYEIIKRAEELSAGKVRLATGTLYPSLERLLAAGRIYRTERVDDDAPARAYYALTEWKR